MKGKMENVEFEKMCQKVGIKKDALCDTIFTRQFKENNRRDEIIEKDKIKVYCWNYGKGFYIEKQNVFVGDLFCSDNCRKEDYEKWLRGEN